MNPQVLGGRLNRLWQDEEIGFSNEFFVSQENQENVRQHYYFPLSRKNIVYEFYSLRAEWKNETRFSSSILEICTNQAYQQIIGMGEEVLPFIFDELRKEPDHWFWALKAITRVDPVKSSERGNIKLMTSVWLIWWTLNNYKYYD